MFGTEEGTWAQRAVGAAAKFVATAKRIAFLSADRRVSEEKRAHTLELLPFLQSKLKGPPPDLRPDVAVPRTDVEGRRILLLGFGRRPG